MTEKDVEQRARIKFIKNYVIKFEGRMFLRAKSIEEAMHMFRRGNVNLNEVDISEIEEE